MAELSIISLTTVIRGNIRGDGSIQIDGKVGGNVEVSGDVTLGQDAEVSGDISGATLTIAGSVSGDLTGTEAVLVEATGKVVGDLRAQRIGIAEGALVRGAVQTGDAPSPARAAPRVVARPVSTTSSLSGRARPPSAVKASPAKPLERPQAEVPQAKTTEKKASAETGQRGKRKPPPPVISVPRKGARGRKKKGTRR